MVSSVRTVLARQIPVRAIPVVELRFAFCELIDAVVPAVRDLANLTAGRQKQQSPDPEATENSVHGKVRSQPDGGGRDPTPGVDRACHTSVVASTDLAVGSSGYFENDASLEENDSTSRQGLRRFPARVAAGNCGGETHAGEAIRVRWLAPGRSGIDHCLASPGFLNSRPLPFGIL